MTKRFRSKGEKKKRSFFKLKLIFFILFIFLSSNITYSLLKDKNTKLYNEEFLKMLISETNHNIIYKYKPSKIISTAITLLSNINISKPVSILGININSKNIVPVNNLTEASADEYNANELEKLSDYIKDPNPTKVLKPRVYIYNSHQLENYSTKNVEIYNIRPNVLMAAYMLKEKLNNLGIYSVVNDANMAEFMRVNNFDHGDSYKASRVFMIDAKNKYDALEYYIDIHRDSTRKEGSTTVINGKSYARTLFVVGLENPDYASNLKLASSIDSIIKQKYPGLSRGVLKKQGKGVNGIYNQDMSKDAMLIEIGGVDNTIDEVLNTIDAISNVLYTYIEAKE